MWKVIHLIDKKQVLAVDYYFLVSGQKENTLTVNLIKK